MTLAIADTEAIYGFDVEEPGKPPTDYVVGFTTPICKWSASSPTLEDSDSGEFRQLPMVVRGQDAEMSPMCTQLGRLHLWHPLLLLLLQGFQAWLQQRDHMSFGLKIRGKNHVNHRLADSTIPALSLSS